MNCEHDLASAAVFFRHALDLEPNNSVILSKRAVLASRLGRIEEAIELAPGNEIARANLAIFYLFAEQPDESVAELERLERDLYRFLVGALAFSAVDRAAESDAALAQLIEHYGDSSAYYVAAVYAWRNDRDAAFEWLDRAVGEGQSTGGITSRRFSTA